MFHYWIYRPWYQSNGTTPKDERFKSGTDLSLCVVFGPSRDTLDRPNDLSASGYGHSATDLLLDAHLFHNRKFSHPRFFQLHIPCVRLEQYPYSSSLFNAHQGKFMLNLRIILILSIVGNALLTLLFLTDKGPA